MCGLRSTRQTAHLVRRQTAHPVRQQTAHPVRQQTAHLVRQQTAHPVRQQTAHLVCQQASDWMSGKTACSREDPSSAIDHGGERSWKLPKLIGS